MTDEELARAGEFGNRDRVAAFGLRFPLDAGEAACLALALHRDWVLATDDGDALTVLHQIRPNHPYERIRRLLRRAVTEGRLAEDDANRVHERDDGARILGRRASVSDRWLT